MSASDHPDVPGGGETATTVRGLVTFALNRSSSADRATALIGLVPYLTDDQLAVVLEAGLEFEDELDRCRVTDAIAPRATPEQLHRILAGTLRLSTPDNRLVGLASLLPHLPEAYRAVAVEAATAAAERAHPMTLVMSSAVVNLAPWCTPTQLERITAAVVGRVSDQALRAHLLTWVAKFLSGRLLDETVTTICAIADGNLRAVTLTGLAPVVIGEHLAAVEAAAYAIDHGAARARALAGIAPHLPGPRRQSAITAALAAVTAADTYDTLRGIALRDLLPLLDQDQVALVLDADAADIDTHTHSWLKAVAPNAAPDRLAAAVAEYLAPHRLGDALTGVRLPRYMADQLAELVSYLPAGLRNAAAVSAVSLLGQVSDRQWGQRLGVLAPHLTPDQLNDAFRMADPQHHPLALCDGVEHLAAHLSGDRLDEVLAAVLALTEDTHRSEALAGIAPHLGATRIDHAVKAATDLLDPQLRVETLVAILPHLPPGRQPAVAHTALLTTATIDPIEDRTDLLLRLAGALPPAHRAPVLSRAITAMTAVPDGPAQTRMLTTTAALLVADRPELHADG
ncbi:hypothetical protein ACQEVZ_45005 [Dactylosporangium sp. CA-152071]|uniref:hypothetical protein n=1 Tax=Dactylosporangium sp. CA-152071 TaxID=3239933 RepID=UPI003D92D94F